ncbi:Lrp/AsnC family transcriptional regulator [Brooklawnia cerclae]|uniref:DNA-binding Lrp family transcriptional regulator n=1 Tax=Brooklawnia cerclae TaxID=349934 RepID=A0ABX0SII2_9ACTN|nr:DNA-binding Lrp family transcriptional regulator [Brooklawnia cerclae]
MILQLLIAHGRMPNAAIAQAASVAESTAHNRVNALTEAGVIRGIHAEVDLAAVGRPIEAMIQVQIQPTARSRLREEAERLANCPGVVEVFFLAGSRDLLVRVAVADAAALRDFVVNELNRWPTVAATETSMVLEHFRGTQMLVLSA